MIAFFRNTLWGFKGVIITPFGAKKPLTPLRGNNFPLDPYYVRRIV